MGWGTGPLNPSVPSAFYSCKPCIDTSSSKKHLYTKKYIAIKNSTPANANMTILSPSAIAVLPIITPTL